MMRLRPCALAILLAFSCKDPYTPTVPGGNNHFLVVDGNINAGAQTRIRLTRTTKVNDTAAVAAVHGANISISQGNTVYILLETGDSGYYQVSTAGLQFTTCKLAIQTSDKRQYTSDEIPVLQTPEIDSITYAYTNKGVQVYANTNNKLNDNRYYHWDYDETWEYHPPYESVIAYDWSKRMLNYRTVAEIDSLYNCYKTAFSTQLFNYSTSSISVNDVVQFPLEFIPRGDVRLSDTYSINVNQYSITSGAYNYLQVLKKTTQDLGDVFGPLPSQLRSNIRAVNNDDVVIGYITASNVTRQRVFIYNQKLQGWGYTFNYLGIPLNKMGADIGVPLDNQAVYFFEQASPCAPDPTPGVPKPCPNLYGACCAKAYPLRPIDAPGVIQFAYDSTCADCMFWGTGGRKKPSYWPN